MGKPGLIYAKEKKNHSGSKREELISTNEASEWLESMHGLHKAEQVDIKRPLPYAIHGSDIGQISRKGLVLSS